MNSNRSQEYSEYQLNFNSPPLSKRFDTIKFYQIFTSKVQRIPRQENPYFTKLQWKSKNPIVSLLIDIDFKIKGPAPYTHLDIKHPVGSEILRKQGPYRMGKEIIERFCGLEQGLESSENLLHIVDLGYLPPHEKQIVKEAEDPGSSERIKFLNDK